MCTCCAKPRPAILASQTRAGHRGLEANLFSRPRALRCFAPTEADVLMMYTVARRHSSKPPLSRKLNGQQLHHVMLAENAGDLPCHPFSRTTLSLTDAQAVTCETAEFHGLLSQAQQLEWLATPDTHPAVRRPHLGPKLFVLLLSHRDFQVLRRQLHWSMHGRCTVNARQWRWGMRPAVPPHHSRRGRHHPSHASRAQTPCPPRTLGAFPCNPEPRTMPGVLACMLTALAPAGVSCSHCQAP